MTNTLFREWFDNEILIEQIVDKFFKHINKSRLTEEFNGNPKQSANIMRWYGLLNHTGTVPKAAEDAGFKDDEYSTGKEKLKAAFPIADAKFASRYMPIIKKLARKKSKGNDANADDIASIAYDKIRNLLINPAEKDESRNKIKKGDWKINNDGHLFTEKLGKKEAYGKQIVNSMDLLTTDGTLANKFDFFDSDGKEKSISPVATTVVAENSSEDSEYTED